MALYAARDDYISVAVGSGVVAVRCGDRMVGRPGIELCEVVVVAWMLGWRDGGMNSEGDVGYHTGAA